MTLLIDIGNTAVKWAIADGVGRLGQVGVEVHHGVDDLEARLAAAWRSLPGEGAAVGCSVAPTAVRAAADRAALAGGRSIRWLVSEARHAGAVELANGYRDPLQLGADRWHGMLGACLRHPGQPFVLVAAGTATTIDCVDATEGGARFVGGCIAPGARMMVDALAQRTAGLPQARGAVVDFPDNTDDAIITGIADAQAGLVAHVVQRFARRLGGAPALLVSGGDAAALAERLLDSGWRPSIEHNLVLAGLSLRAVHGSRSPS
jgi:type III pantothenate kinase